MIRFLSAVAAASLLILGVSYWIAHPKKISGSVIWSSGPTIVHLESLQELVVTKVTVSDILVAEDAGFRGSWLIKGDALISIDMTEAEVVDLHSENRTATIRLPRPHVISPRVDFERTKTWDVRKVTWVPWSGDEDDMRDQAMYHAQKLVEQAARSQENLEAAESHAVLVIQATYRMVDWHVEVQWEPSGEPSREKSPS
jgi:hypothetical protein